MRRLAIVLAVLVLLSVGLRLAAKPVVGSDWFRAQVEAVASRALRVEVTIADPIEPSISLIPGLELSSLRFASPGEAEWWLEAEAEALSLRIRLPSLLRGRFETRMRANGVIVRFALPPEQDESPSTFDLAALIEGLPDTRIENARIRQGRPGQAEGLRLEIEAASLRGCGRALDFEGEVFGLPLSVATKLVCEDARALRFEELEAEFMRLPLEGELALSFGSPGTHLTGAFSASRLELADLTGSETSDAESSEDWLDETLPFDRLDVLDLDLTLAVQEVAAFGLSFANAAFEATLRGGRLELKARAGFEEGSVAATLRADGGDAVEALSLDLDLHDLPLAQLYDGEGVSGTYAVDLELVGTGRTVREVLASGTGSLDFELGEAYYPEPLLGPLGKDVTSVLTSQFQSAQPTRIECIVARSEFHAGIGMPTAMVVATPEMTLAGGGVIDLRRMHLDLRLRPRPKTAKIIAVKTPLRIVGPFDDLSAGLDTTEMAMDVGRMVTEGLLDPWKVASVFVDLGSGGEDVCELDLEQETEEKAPSLFQTTTEAARGAGGWLFGIFGSDSADR